MWSRTSRRSLCSRPCRQSSSNEHDRDNQPRLGGAAGDRAATVATPTSVSSTSWRYSSIPAIFASSSSPSKPSNSCQSRTCATDPTPPRFRRVHACTDARPPPNLSRPRTREPPLTPVGCAGRAHRTRNSSFWKTGGLTPLSTGSGSGSSLPPPPSAAGSPPLCMLCVMRPYLPVTWASVSQDISNSQSIQRSDGDHDVTEVALGEQRQVLEVVLLDTVLHVVDLVRGDQRREPEDAAPTPR
jgi:hypothetical protein